MAKDVTHVVVMFSSPASAQTDHSRATTSSELSTVKTLPWVTIPEQHVLSEAASGPAHGPAPAEQVVQAPDERLHSRGEGAHDAARRQVVAVVGNRLLMRGW